MFLIPTLNLSLLIVVLFSPLMLISIHSTEMNKCRDHWFDLLRSNFRWASLWLLVFFIFLGWFIYVIPDLIQDPRYQL